MKNISLVFMFGLLTVSCQCQNNVKTKETQTTPKVSTTTSTKTSTSTASTSPKTSTSTTNATPKTTTSQTSVASSTNQNTSSTQIDKNGMIYLREGQNVFLKDLQMNVTFNKVTEDNRCPMNARCITAGNATAEIEFMGTYTRPQKLHLSVYQDDKGGKTRFGEFNGWLVTLEELNPMTTTDKSYQELKGSYKVKLSFARGTPVDPKLQR